MFASKSGGQPAPWDLCDDVTPEKGSQHKTTQLLIPVKLTLKEYFRHCVLNDNTIEIVNDQRVVIGYFTTISDNITTKEEPE